MEKDIFDVLDISLQEDSYTSLIKHVLEFQEETLHGLTELLIGGRDVRSVGELMFRRELPDTQDKPDLWWDAQTADGPVRLILEFKVTAGESGQQLANYHLANAAPLANGDLVELHLFYVTLDGSTASSPRWNPLSHGELIGMMEQVVDSEGLDDLAQNPVWRNAWQAYRQRVRSFQTHQDTPVDTDTPFMEWFSRAVSEPADGFITTKSRVRQMAKAFQPHSENWLCRGDLFQGMGQAKSLVILQPERWLSEPFTKTGTLKGNYNLHFEIKIPLAKKEITEVTLQFHVESSPYVPAHSLPSDGRELFEQFRESFQQALHAELRSKACGAWRPAGYPNCKARAKISVSRETTVGDLQTAIIDRMKQTEPCIDRLLGDLTPSVGQPIATLTQTLRRECFHVVSRQDRTTVYVRQVVWEGPHNPQTRLDVAQDLSPQATDEQIEQAMFSALANPRYFGRCSYCHKLLLTGQMHSPDVCQSCAEQHLGVIH